MPTYELEIRFAPLFRSVEAATPEEARRETELDYIRLGLEIDDIYVVSLDEYQDDPGEDDSWS